MVPMPCAGSADRCRELQASLLRRIRALCRSADEASCPWAVYGCACSLACSTFEIHAVGMCWQPSLWSVTIRIPEICNKSEHRRKNVLRQKYKPFLAVQRTVQGQDLRQPPAPCRPEIPATKQLDLLLQSICTALECNCGAEQKGSYSVNRRLINLIH